MAEYRLKPGKLGNAVIGAYKKIEDKFTDAFLEPDGAGGPPTLRTGKTGEAAVDGYKKIETAVVGGYKKIEDKFVDAFLEKVEPDEGSDAKREE